MPSAVKVTASVCCAAALSITTRRGGKAPDCMRALMDEEAVRMAEMEERSRGRISCEYLGFVRILRRRVTEGTSRTQYRAWLVAA